LKSNFTNLSFFFLSLIFFFYLYKKKTNPIYLEYQEFDKTISINHQVIGIFIYKKTNFRFIILIIK